MKERFKRELTVQAAHQDLRALSEWEQKTNRTDRIGCLISSILGIGVLTAMTIFMISSGAGVSFAFLLLIAFFVWGLVCSCKPVKRQAVDPEKIRLIRDTVVSGRVEYDDDNSYFLSFRELGEVEVPRKEDEHLRLRLRPGYATTKTGDAFLPALEFVIRYCPPDLQKEAEAEYTPRQKKLSALLRDLQKSDDTRKKHRESVNKVIHIFRRERDE